MAYSTSAIAAPLLLSLLLLSSPAGALSIEGVVYEDRIEVGGQRLELRGAGLLRYRVVFRGYTAALYLAPGADASRALADVPKRLEISYFWKIPGDRFAEAAERILGRTLDRGALAALRSRLERFHELYEDVAPGDRYALTYVPGIGTELAKNGVALGTVPGADFAEAYFGIWLGQSPIDAGLRARLLSEG